jgi:hypothetical protein
MLLAVLKGNLGVLSHSKHPALFCPVCPPGGQEAVDVRFHAETPGFYLRRDCFEGAVGRAGRTVLVITQGSVLINIRRLSTAAT